MEILDALFSSITIRLKSNPPFVAEACLAIFSCIISIFLFSDLYYTVKEIRSNQIRNNNALASEEIENSDKNNTSNIKKQSKHEINKALDPDIFHKLQLINNIPKLESDEASRFDFYFPEGEIVFGYELDKKIRYFLTVSPSEHLQRENLLKNKRNQLKLKKCLKSHTKFQLNRNIPLNDSSSIDSRDNYNYDPNLDLKRTFSIQISRNKKGTILEPSISLSISNYSSLYNNIEISRRSSSYFYSNSTTTRHSFDDIEDEENQNNYWEYIPLK